MGRLIGKKIDEAIKVEVDENDISWGKYMRVCSNLDVTKPLLRGSKVNVGANKPYWIPFSHKHLPNLCYLCG